ncbi:MAG: sugar transferase [Pseudomonadota bacterium]
MTVHSTDLHDMTQDFAARRSTLGWASSRAASRSRIDRTYRRGAKRAFELALVIAAAPFWMAIILISALLVACDGHLPFYTQLRIGRSGRIFRMWKLRSMVPDAEARLQAHLAADPKARAEWDALQKLKDDPRITPVGRVLRKTSIDELPQLWNVLVGDMSLVGPRPMMFGPRPMMVSQRELYHGANYYALRPGLTGFWQISDRNECGFRDRVRFDDAYERAVSLRTDLVVLWRTVAVVLRGTGY